VAEDKGDQLATEEIKSINGDDPKHQLGIGGGDRRLTCLHARSRDYPGSMEASLLGG